MNMIYFPLLVACLMPVKVNQSMFLWNKLDDLRVSLMITQQACVHRTKGQLPCVKDVRKISQRELIFSCTHRQ